MTRWDDETSQKASALFSTLPLKELRRRQDLCQAQIGVAHQTRNDDALADLQSMERALERAVGERLDQ